MGKEAEEFLRQNPQLAQLDAVQAVPALRELGRAYANEHVRIEHLI
jgi:hypothetical protein